MLAFGRRFARIRAAADRRVDGAGLAAFRILFGLVAAWGAARFLLNGWVDEFFVEPDFRFAYRGFGFVTELSPAAMHAAYVAMVVLGLLIAAGAFYRVSVAAYFLLFSYVELIDVTYYLNHYYLVSLLSLLLIFVPANRLWSLDAWLATRRRRPLRVDVAACSYWVLRAQVAIVYFHAALAKAQPDWLVHAQPLNLWLAARADLPVVGPLFEHWETALFMSWAGFLYDLTIPAWLSFRRTRPLAYVAVLGFHAMTRILFMIGMFPLIMVVATTTFFEPEWPRRLVRIGRDAAREAIGSASQVRVPSAALLAFAGYLAFHAVFPLRSHLYGGSVLWHEQGMRWSWRVMVREKNGAVYYRVHLADGRVHEVTPASMLSDFQEREMSGQPDLIVALGHAIAADYEARGDEVVALYVDALVSFNGRPAAPLIDPTVDLLDVQPSMRHAEWILPAPTSTPRRVGRGNTRPPGQP
jgi:vitamin K-dependent gamma-carboxylase